MITAMKPKPIPASKTLNARPIAPVGEKSPYPRVKKVSPLRYAHVPKLGACVSIPIGEPSDQWNNANEKISDITHSENSPSSESGPNILKKCCRNPRRLKASATRTQTCQKMR